MTIRHNSLFDAQNSIDPWAIFTLYTSDTCKSPPLAIVRRSQSGDSHPQRYRAALLVALPLTPHEAVATPRERRSSGKTAPLHSGDGCSFCRPIARDSGFLLSGDTKIDHPE